MTDSLKVLLAVLLILCLLGGLYVVQAGISARRAAEGIVETDIFEAMTPETFATTVLLAGFRGILADMLWLRAIKMQDEEQWFELQAIYELITKLQPDFEQVWDYAAWNLAYNISFDAGSLDEKWGWLNAGASILIEGIARNPRSYFLRWRLGELYMRKYTDSRYPAFAEWLRKETDRHPYEHALEWFSAAVDSERFPKHTLLQDISMAQVHEKLAELSLEEARTQDQVDHIETALDWWGLVLHEFPNNQVGEKRIFQLLGDLAPAYRSLLQENPSGANAGSILRELRDVADKAHLLWGGYEEGDMERLWIAAKAQTELARALFLVDGLEAAGEELRKAEELLQLTRELTGRAYERMPGRPEFLYYQGDATMYLATSASMRGDSDRERALHQEALEIFYALKRKLVSYGDTHKRTDYKAIENIIDEEIPELEAKLALAEGTAVQEPTVGGG